MLRFWTEHGKKGMKIQFLVLKIYSSIIKRIHSWGLLSLILLIYLSSLAIKLPIMVTLFSRLGLMTLHVFCGFITVFFLIIMAYNFLLDTIFKKDSPGDEKKKGSGILSPHESGNRFLVELLFYSSFFVVCFLGVVYYVIKEFSLQGTYFSQNVASLAHVIVGWFFISIVFIRYYLKITQWFSDVFQYLRENEAQY